MRYLLNMSIHVQVDHLSEKELEKAVDEDIDRFAEFFCSLGNDVLVQPERAAIKTWLWWKTHDEPRALEPARVHGETSGESNAKETGG